VLKFRRGGQGGCVRVLGGGAQQTFPFSFFVI
jgi:hypothetical protein